VASASAVQPRSSADAVAAAPDPIFSFAPQVDRQAADRAAIALGLLFPLFGYPIGLAFIMLDDPRKLQLGKLTILWSTIGLVLSLFVSLAVAAPLLTIGKELLPSNPLSHATLPSDDSE
jgi:hypothetical protein